MKTDKLSTILSISSMIPFALFIILYLLDHIVPSAILFCLMISIALAAISVKEPVAGTSLITILLLIGLAIYIRKDKYFGVAIAAIPILSCIIWYTALKITKTERMN